MMPGIVAESCDDLPYGPGQSDWEFERWRQEMDDNLESDRAELIEALRRSMVAIDDWLNTYASEMCDAGRVQQARMRISEGGGTLAYIADIQEANRDLLARLESK